MPLFKEKYDVDDEMIRDLRSRFLEEVKSGPEVAREYHADDIARVKENDWFLARYILHKDYDMDQSFQMLKESLKYRNEMKINTLRKEDLPADYFADRSVFIYNKDHRDHPIVVIRAKFHKKKLDMRYFQQQFFLYWVEKAVRQGGDWGFVTILFDLTDSGYNNMDLDMIQFMLQVFQKQYAWALGYFFVYNMPWYLSTIWKLVKQWVPKKYISKILFLDSKSISEYVEKDQLPECMGGTCTDMYALKSP